MKGFILYSCKYCAKEFSTSKGLNGHIGHCTNNPANQVEETCPFCGSLVVNKKQIVQHINHCTLNPNKKEYKISIKRECQELLEQHCAFCGKICSSNLSLSCHTRVCPSNPDRSKSNVETAREQGKIKSWNRSLTKHTDSRVARNSMNIKLYYETHPGTFLGKHHSEESKQLLSKKQTELFHKDDNRCVRTCHGWYNDVYFMSGWEFAYYIYMKDTGHEIVRCTERFPYYYKNKKHYYYPDFLVDGHLIVEIKGLESEKDRLKYAAVPKLVVLKEAELKEAITYAKAKFKTDNFQTLLYLKKQ